MMLQVPVLSKVSTPALVTVHTALVLLVKLTASAEVLVATKVGAAPKLCGPGLAKVMVCVPFGVTLLDAADALPVPALLVAVTVKV